MTTASVSIPSRLEVNASFYCCEPRDASKSQEVFYFAVTGKVHED